MVSFLKPETKDGIGELREVMDYLWIVRDSSQNDDPRFINQNYILSRDLVPLMENGPSNEFGHSMRTAEYGVMLSDLLSFGPQGKILKFLTDISHDRGKLKFQDCYIKADRDEAAREKIKIGHVLPQNIPLEYGLVVASAIEQHHTHQRVFSKPYPDKLYFPRTEESFMLSQLLAIFDFWDAITSRPCAKSGNMHTYDESVNLWAREYANMQIQYNGGPMFPKIRTTGKEIMDEFLNSNKE